MLRPQVVLFVIASVFLPSAHAVSIPGARGLVVALDSDGTYSVAVSSPAWRFTGNVGAPVGNVQVGSGADNLGTFNEISFDFKAGVLRHASIRSYWERAVVMFTLKYPDAAGPNTLQPAASNENHRPCSNRL